MFRPLLLLITALLAACATGSADYSDQRAPRAAPIVALTSDRPLVALALGSGGSRGFAHVGVIKVLEDAGITADIVWDIPDPVGTAIDGFRVTYEQVEQAVAGLPEAIGEHR